MSENHTGKWLQQTTLALVMLPAKGAAPLGLGQL